MANWGSIANAAGMAVSGYAKDKERIRAEALQAQQAERQARQDAILQAVEARRVASPITIRENWAKAMGGDQDAVGAVVSAEPTLADNFQTPDRAVPPPQVVSPGQGIRQPDGTYKVPVPALPKEPSLISVANPKGDGTMVRTPDVPGTEVPGPGGVSGIGTAAIRKAIAANRTQMATIDAAIAELDANPDAVGWKRGLGMLPGMGEIAGQVNQRMNPEGEGARNALQNVESLTFLDRSGKAVTKNEMARQGFIPNAASTPEANRRKLQDLKKWAEVETQFLEQGLGAGHGHAGDGSKPAANEAQALWDAAVARHGRAKVEQTYGPRP